MNGPPITSDRHKNRVRIICLVRSQDTDSMVWRNQVGGYFYLDMGHIHSKSLQESILSYFFMTYYLHFVNGISNEKLYFIDFL